MISSMFYDILNIEMMSRSLSNFCMEMEAAGECSCVKMLMWRLEPTTPQLSRVGRLRGD